MTTVFDQLSHHAGTNDVNQIRLEIKLSKPRTKPQHVSDLQITEQPTHCTILLLLILVKLPNFDC